MQKAFANSLMSPQGKDETDSNYAVNKSRTAKGRYSDPFISPTAKDSPPPAFGANVINPSVE